MSSMIPRGNLSKLEVLSLTLTPSAVSANTSAEQTFTVPGLLTTDVVIGVSKPTTQAGLGIVGYRISAANTLAITFGNFSAGSITPTASQVYQVTIARPDSATTVWQ